MPEDVKENEAAAEEQSADEQSKCILECQEENLHLSLHLSEDKLKLFITATTPEEGKPSEITENYLFSLVRDTIPPERFKQNVVESVINSLKKRTEISKRLIASGRAPVKGEDGSVEYLVRRLHPRESKEELRIDGASVRKLQNVDSGKQLARIHPPKDGKNGFDVFGENIQAEPGEVATAPHDDSISEKSLGGEHDAVTLFADKIGYLAEVKGELRVVEHLVIDGNIDVSSGDIDFNGSVHIKGNVVDGFNVGVCGDVTIEGNIYGGSVLSTEGSVTVTGFISGTRKPRISAAQRVTANSIQDAFIEAVGDIFIIKEARDSFLRTKGSVRLKGGHLFGGEIRSHTGVEATQIGSSGGSRTRIILITEVDASATYRELSSQLAEHEDAIEQMSSKLGAIGDYTPEQLQRNKKELASLLPIVSKFQQLKDSRKALQNQMQELVTAEREATIFRVNYFSNLYRGVEIIVDEHRFVPDDSLSGPGTVEFTWKKKKFSVGEMQELPEDGLGEESAEE